MREIVRLSLEERRARGGQARQEVPLSGAAGWSPAADRADPVALLEAQDLTREPDLVPVRHGRMMVSPFTFYRGAAKIMAADLGSMPAAGLGVQLCGDAHLLNFGVYASPERRLVFDLNDFDETLPGPFEYDVKRMAASFAIAGRDNGYLRRGHPRGDAGVGDRLPGGHGRVRADADAGYLVCPAARRRADGRGPRHRGGHGAGRPRASRGRRRPRRRRRPPSAGKSWPARPARGTACRRCPSWASWPMAGTGSSASRRSSSPPATWPPPSASPPT